METARHLPRSCKPEPGGVLAVVDRGRCEAKSACVAVCPYDVFEVRALTSGERAAMPVWGRLNLRPHRGRQAVVVAPETAATRAAFVFVPAKKGPSACSARWPDMRRDQTIELTCSASTAWEIIGDYGNDAWWRGEVAGITSQPPGPVHTGTEVLGLATRGAGGPAHRHRAGLRRYVRHADGQPRAGAAGLGRPTRGHGRGGRRPLVTTGQACPIHALPAPRARIRRRPSGRPERVGDLQDAGREAA